MNLTHIFPLNTQTAGVPYTEQNQLHGQWWEFRLWSNTQKTKENDVKTILFSLDYLTPIKLLFCMSTGRRASEREREREREKFKGQKPFNSQVNDKEW